MKFYNEIEGTAMGAIKAVAQRCYIKKVFLEISQNSQENTCASHFFN